MIKRLILMVWQPILVFLDIGESRSLYVCLLIFVVASLEIICKLSYSYLKLILRTLRSYQYCYMDALGGRKLNGWRKSLTATIQELNKSWRQHLTKRQLYGHLPPITKLSKLDEPDIRDTGGKVRTSS